MIKTAPAEITQKLHIQRFKLEQLSAKLQNRANQTRLEAKRCLERGDERGFRIASRKYSLSKNSLQSVGDLREMAENIIDILEMGEIMHGIVEVGGNLARAQKQLGLDAPRLESSLAKIRTSVTRIDDIASLLSATIDSTLTSSKELSTDQESLRKELLIEIQAGKLEEEKLKDQIRKELDQAGES